MNINFDKSNRLIELINESCMAIDSFHFRGAFDLKQSKNAKRNILYEELININQKNLSTEEKYKIQIEKFAEAYSCKGDLEKGESFLKLTFDEDKILERLTRGYWQISPIRIIQTGNATIDDLRQFVNKYYSKEPCKEVMIETILKQEPTEVDIEREFWNNCTDVDKINEFCNIY